MSRGAWRPGAFVWRELMTGDVEAASRFYGSVLGWTFEDATTPAGPYRLAYSAEGTQIAGMMTAMQGAPTAWTPYLSVADVDAAAEGAKAAGGQVVWGPHDIPGVGRVVWVVDPLGATVALYRDAKGDAEPKQPSPGEFCWESLTTSDPGASIAFLSRLVPWEKIDFNGINTVRRVGEEEAVADVSPLGEGDIPGWISHVAVGDLDAALARVEAAGGRALSPVVPIADVGRMAVVADPTGAALSLFQFGG
jgi:predicted enzyme related to lactoylglutathione lyase